VRFRHSESTKDKVESQLKKAIAARKPKMHKVAGSGSRIEALTSGSNRTGKGWTSTQYALWFARSGLASRCCFTSRPARCCCRWASACWSVRACRTWCRQLFINKRTNAFNAKFPDAIELLVRGLRSGLPVTETLGVVATKFPAPWARNSSAVERIKIGRTMEEALQETADRSARRIPVLRHHPGDPARDRRQPGRNAVEPRRRAAQARADEAQDPRDELGIQGLGLYRRRPAVHRVRHDLVDQPELHRRLLCDDA
jgi:hypothetical protein